MVLQTYVNVDTCAYSLSEFSLHNYICSNFCAELVFEMFKRTGTDAVYEIEEYQLQKEKGDVFSNEVKKQS